MEKHTIPSNMVLWSTGIAMQQFTGRVSSLLPNQVHKKAIVTDAHLRVKGAPVGQVYAVGDCATVCARLSRAVCDVEADRSFLQIETNLVGYFMDLVEGADKDKDGKISYDEWQHMGESHSFGSVLISWSLITPCVVELIKHRIPMAENHVSKVRELFEKYDKDHDENLSLNETLRLLEAVSQKITALPAVRFSPRIIHLYRIL